ncbi:MAG: hypothetical protein EBT74_03925, partial [Gammaproteobacteria bacterium]|nr:hypothetical protein [Gammaproteobacteria bacterium]
HHDECGCADIKISSQPCQISSFGMTDMTDNQQHIYSERVEAIRQAILEAFADYDVTREQFLKDLLLWEEIEEYLNRTTKKD